MLINYLNKIPPIDLFSFVLGLVLGAILYIVVVRVRTTFLHARVSGKKIKNKKEQRSSNKNFDQYSMELLRRVQSDHLLSALCPLNTIYVPRQLIYPYPYIDPKNKNIDTIEASNLIPFLPEFPIFYESIPFRSCSLNSAIANHDRILILGSIGSGKTTLINHTISNVLENKEDTAQIKGFTPFYIHYSEINFDSLEDIEEPINPILNTRQLQKISLSKGGFINTFLPLFSQGKAVLFLDGLDEAEPSIISRFSSWMESLLRVYPTIKIVISGNLSFTNGFSSIGFENFYISPFTVGNRKDLSAKISNLAINFDILKKHNSFLNFAELSHLKNKSDFSNNPALITLSLLSEYSLSGEIKTSSGLISHYINHFIASSSHFSRLVQVANKMIKTPSHQISKDEALGILGDISDSVSSEAYTKDKSFFEILLDLGLFIEREPGFFSFQSFFVMTYLASQEFDRVDTSDWEKYFFDPALNLMLFFSREISYIHSWLISKNLPLYKNLDVLQTHIEKVNNDPVAQNTELPIIISSLLSNNLSLPIKLKYLSVLLKFDTETASKALDHIATKSPNSRIISIIGYGSINTEKSIKFLKSFINLGTPLEKALSVISLCRIDQPEARLALLNSLQSGDDLHRRIVCELLSTDYIDGHTSLKELSANPNIAIRKSSIFGIKLIKAPWVTEFLTNMSTKDSEWLVRDSAAASLEEVTTHQIELRKIIPEHPSKLEWLLAIASQRGQGISAKSIPNDLLIDLMKNGQTYDKLASIYILSKYPNKEVMDLLIQLFEDETDLSDQAFFYSSEISRQESIV